MKDAIPFRCAAGGLALLTLALAQAPKRVIYPEKADARAEIRAAIERAHKEHKRVILDFGGNWCGDCRALDTYFHQAPNASLLRAHFILVDVNIGQFDLNKDLAKEFEVPLEKGVPALAVIDAQGRVLYSQKNGEFESMGRMDPSSVTAFLDKWK